MNEDQQESARVAFMLANSGIWETWLAYFGAGGDLDEWDVDAYLHGVLQLPALDRDLLAIALNERLADLELPQLASYSG
jgi:hypothetical protein